jgi:hypothetical protein
VSAHPNIFFHINVCTFYLSCALLVYITCEVLVRIGYDVILSFWTGKIFEKVCEACHISINKTPIYGDNGSISPGGVRIG